MFIIQIVGMFEAETQEEALEEAQRLGKMITDATVGRKGTVFAEIAAGKKGTGLMEHVQKIVDQKQKEAN